MSFSVSDGTGRLRVQQCVAQRPVRQARAPRHARGFTAWSPISPGSTAPRGSCSRDRADDVSLGDWLERHRFSRGVHRAADRASGVGGVVGRLRGRCGAFPARFLVEFFDNHGMLSFRGRPRWRTVRGGSARYVEALTRPFGDRLRLSHAGRCRHAPRRITCWSRRVAASAERFDEVVLATHSDQALALLRDADRP